jgi:hypothetical protein
MTESVVRKHVRQPKGRWPFAVRQHVRHRWVLPERRTMPPFDEYGSEMGMNWRPQIVEVDPALILLSGNPERDRKQLREFLSERGEGPTTRPYIQRLRAGLPMDPVEVGLNANGEEELFGGAHRTTAAIASGIRRMPVAFYDVETGGPASDRQISAWQRRAKRRIRREMAEEPR